MSKYDYNLIVIGAGSAGLVTSYIAAAAKAKVALIERHKMGGDCLNTGCVPSKALIRTAKVMRDARRAKALGLKKVEVEFDFAEVMARVQRVIAAIEPHDSVERYTSLGVDCFSGEANIVSPHEVEVDGKKLTARSLVICAGAAPFVPPIKGLEDAPHCNSDTVWELRELPKRLAVLGGGPIGCELAQCFAYLGSEVVQIDSGARLMHREDEDASVIVGEKMREAGVKTIFHAKAREVVKEGGGWTLVCDSSGGEQRAPFDMLLLAAGRRPNGDKVRGLAETGVKIDERGAVQVNAHLQTDVPNIFACGDITGGYQFTHTAGHAAFYAATNAMLPGVKLKVDWSVVPWCTFTHPEVARVGLNEADAKANNVLAEVTKYGIDDLDRAIADEEAEGFVKVLTVPGTGKILGATIVGEHAGDLISEFVLAMKAKLSLNDILGTIHIYPTLAEANKMAAGAWKRNHLSPAALAWGKRFNDWMR